MSLKTRHCVEHVDEPRDVVLVVRKRLRDRFPDVGEGREMDDGLRLIAFERQVKVGGLKYVTLNERAPLDHVPVPARQVIKRNRLQSVGRQSLARMGTDVSSAAGNQNRLHFASSRVCPRQVAGSSPIVKTKPKPMKAEFRLRYYLTE
jgi:hypothetical protein